eukprot:TRINITY_DN43046_c0_g1_i1.p1 TRINITY_DN43046_c0_g1~~TRINITY_DN43046_c0_g1_i1.p1  ORF type:complete len:397 (+),score=90.51 TRINITY_DN43046_c0_g1_i1:46-1236(+)
MASGLDEAQQPEEGEEGGSEFEIEDTVVIIDNGSGLCKAGLSSDNAPTCIFPEVVGRARESWKAAGGLKDFYLGDEITADLRTKVSLTHPMENGEIEDFDGMEMLWEHIFEQKLKVDPERHPVLLTEPPYNPTAKRERMVEVMFETFRVPSLNISIQGVLALLGQGRTTGLVLDSGEGVTHCVPIFDGFGLPHCINRLDLAGRELNTMLAKLLAMENKCNLTTTADQHAARLMKEKHCYVTLDPSVEVAEEVDYRMPNGKLVRLGDERWKCPEALFNPALAGLESVGVGMMCWDSISRCDVDLRKTLLSNVVLSGGCTMFPGFSERLCKELRSFAPAAAQTDIRVLKSKDQISAVWTGGQVSASLREMQEDQWMSIDDFYECGPAHIHDKIAVKYS